MQHNSRSKTKAKSDGLEPQRNKLSGQILLFTTTCVVGLLVIGVVWFSFKQEKISMVNQINELNSKLDSMHQDLQSMRENNPINTQSYAIARVKDAYFIVRIAEDRLNSANDITSAKQLLQLAQDHLQDIDDPKVAQARSILSADQQKVNAINFPDPRLTQDKLAILDELLMKLPIKGDVAETTNASTTAVASNDEPVETSRWQQSVKNILNQAKSLVKIRKRANPDDNAGYVNSEINRAQFRLLLEQIRWAIFYKDAKIYESSIKQAQQLLPEVFDVNDENVQKFSATLQDLSQVQIRPDVPNIQDSVNALQAILVG